MADRALVAGQSCTEGGRLPRPLLPGIVLNKYCAFGHSCLVPTFFLFGRTPPRQRVPSARNKRSHNMALGSFPLRRWHADCSPHLRARAGSHRASWQASATPTPPLRHWWYWAGATREKAPDASSLGGWTQAARQRRAMAPFQVLPAHRPPPLCAHAPHGWAGYASWRQATNGPRPHWMPTKCGALKTGSSFHAGRLFNDSP